MIKWIEFIKQNTHVDEYMVSQIKREFNYWSAILNRIAAVIRFLAGRGLAFRGHNEVIGSSNNGNYLGMLELLTQFDPVLKQHIDTFANTGKGNVNYLSKTICEELIDIMSQKVLTHIITEIKKAKCWGIIVDSTPDISHVDQLSVTSRYYLNGHVYERFFCFLQIKSHGKSLITDILDLLERYDIDITNCRGQTYDNASNMFGKYSGLQARLKEQSELAFYIPCAGHSLNLMGFIEKKSCYIKRLSDTRWSCRSDASKSLVENFDGIHAELCHIAEDTEEKSDTRHEALCLLNKITKLEFAFMAVLWHHILKRTTCNIINLQPPGFFSHKKDKSETENTLIPLHVLNWIVETDIIDVFPNVYIVYYLFLTIPITNCEAERSFSTLKRVKNMHRSTMVHSRLSNIARLTIESKLLETLDFSDVIAEFAGKKSRKKITQFNSILNSI
ncbi:uncharacterized protein LOC136083152 [Hydra vulgaris]|uniref:Uncharacterized protein LOC136083152 n=1 Tax=Hydra vulgaris TaxID=6087 RepID=A0ABM4CAG3_HYDVU